MLLLIDNYDSFTWNLAQYLGELGEQVEVVRNDAIRADDIAGMAPRRIVISPGPCTPNEAGISLEVIEKYAGRIPILGVCLGHQAIGQVFGGRVVRARQVMHGKLSKIFHDEQGLFDGLANPFWATRYHSLVVDPLGAGEDLAITAKTWDDEVMGLRVTRFAGTATPVEGVQFHPESIKTEAGKQILANFIGMST